MGKQSSAVRGMLRPARITLLWALVCTSSCTDTGVVGSGPDCVPSCSQDEVCDPTRLRCVECATDANCDGKDNGQQPYCDDAKAKCVECRDQQDCQGAQPFCVDGECKKSADPETNHGSDDHSKGDGGMT